MKIRTWILRMKIRTWVLRMKIRTWVLRMGHGKQEAIEAGLCVRGRDIGKGGAVWGMHLSLPSDCSIAHEHHRH